ncbi:signal-induced proliferation-associated 1-like protein 2 [Episyrphus balteatus]|uniref:signal-induced proliferation-associated 1-like protein 2 n=1 Tax=Episyrphus balteatus TaxID=286459 RepID=UPI0024862C32|nr:signal-induced proliferation-associated 1-like protein 2 [Episyrphus balteatus]
MSTYNSINSTKSSKFKNRGIYSTPQNNFTESQYKGMDPPLKKEVLCAHSNQSDSFATSSRDTSKKFQVHKNDSFFDMLQDYQPAVLGVIGTNQRSPGPAEFMQDKDMQYYKHTSNEGYISQPTDCNPSNIKSSRDLKVKNKIHRFLAQPKPKTDDSSLLGSLLSNKTCSMDEDVAKQSTNSVSLVKRTFLSTEEFQEQDRRRTFGHYDCQSIAANLNYVKTNRKISTSAIDSSGAITKPLDSIISEFKNLIPNFNHDNELLESCPLFCNEIGTENELIFRCKKSSTNYQDGFISQPPLKSITPCRVSILEPLPNETLWKVDVCPYLNDACPIESVDHGAHYYRNYFLNQRHENWFGIDENLGPLAISIKKEKINDNGTRRNQTRPNYLFRVIIRNSELLTLRGLIIEDFIINSRVSEKSLTSKELLEYIAPDIQLSCLRLGLSTSNAEQELLKLDEQGLQSKYKVGILYCRSGQSSEEDMYNNEHAGPAFTEFLDIIGKRVRLKGFQHYKAGLDNKSDSTGTHSVYGVYKNCEIMFHVCTLLPFTPNNRQQLLRKRHIGNDIVTIIFQEPGALSFDPNNIRSQFQHVFLIVRAINPCSSNTTYRVAVTRSKEVPYFGPPLSASALFPRNKFFAEFILAKTINAENAAHRSDIFANLATRTRREYLKDLCINYSSNTSIDPGNKFSIFANRKKDKKKNRFSTDLYQRGAICWRILLQNHGSDITTECYMAISIETFIIMEESSKSVIFAMPTRSILGWSTCGYSFKLFYHNGECITFQMSYFGSMDEQLQVVERLEGVTLGNGALNLNMKRNMMGQLGFHVQPDGIVTRVDATGQAWAAGMRRGYRLVEVCKIIVGTLSYAELIDLLKTSVQINAIVIKSVSDGTPRLGCFSKSCKINLMTQKLHYYTNRYHMKNVMSKEVGQHSALNFKSSGTYEQRSLPHKSKNCSNYNGSSYFLSMSLDNGYKKVLQQPDSNSHLFLQNDKWYDSFEYHEKGKLTTYLYNNQCSLKLFEENGEPSDLAIQSRAESSLPHSGKSEVQTWVQNGTSSLLERDIRKFHYRNSEYEVIEFKTPKISQNGSYLEKDITASNSIPSQTNKAVAFDSRSKNKHPIYELNSILSTPNINTTKDDIVLNDLIPFMNSMQVRKKNYSKNNQFRPELYETKNPNCGSYIDDLKKGTVPVFERDIEINGLDANVSSQIRDKLKNTENHQSFESCSDKILNKNKYIQSATGSSTRHSQSTDEDLNKMSTAPPLLPYSKPLDWTTLVDTATKAIILHQRDDNS